MADGSVVRRPAAVNPKARARLFGKSMSMANLDGRPSSPLRLGSPGESLPSNHAIRPIAEDESPVLPWIVSALP